MLIETENNEFIESTEIVRACRTRGVDDRGVQRARAYLRGEERSVVLRVDVETLQLLTGSIVPATPGWRVARYIKAEDGLPASAWMFPIVAWRVDDTCAIPISVERISDEGWAIVTPDGRTYAPYEGDFDNIQEWLKYVEPERDATNKVADA